MRPRHTFRTDSRMEEDRKQISVRLSAFYRQRIKEVTGDEGLPDIHSESDLIQDAVWLWFHEHDLAVEQGLVHGKGARSTRDSLGTHPDNFPEAQGVEVGSPAEAGEGSAGEPSEDSYAPEEVDSVL